MIKQSNLRACRRILRACRHSGTSRRAPKPRASRHLLFSKPQDFPQKSPSHDLSTMSTFYSAKRAGVRVLDHRPSLPLELSALLSDFRSSRSSFGAPIALFFEFCLINLVCGDRPKKSIFVRGSWCLTAKADFMARYAWISLNLILARNVLAFEFWAIGPRSRSNCLHF